METPETETSSVPLFDASMKKKKKKTKKAPSSATATPTKDTAVDEGADEPVDGEDDTELLEAPADGEIPVPTVDDAAGIEEEDDMDMGSMPQSSVGIEVSATGEYSYDQLLKRAFDLIGQVKADKPRIKIPPPQAFRIGTSRTLWANFPQIAKALHRNPQHLLNFVIVELGTTANLDANGRVVIRGRFMPKQLESLVRKYLTEYVVCKTCGSRDTVLKKENRLHFLECQSSVCGSTRSVPALNKGYVHNIRRKKAK